MQAMVITQALPADAQDCFIQTELPVPEPGPEDLLVRVKAIGLNPVDSKVRKNFKPLEGEMKILGWDAAGIVESVGSAVRDFIPGDPVYYAGDVSRDGCYAQYQLVDARIAAKKPASLSFEQAAALPLTTITAWESLFDRLELPAFGEDADFSPSTLLIIGGGGGVGSIGIQLVKYHTGLSVIATASQPVSRDWCLEMGADHVIDHTRPLAEQISTLGYKGVDAIFCLYEPSTHWNNLVGTIIPQGRICCLVDSDQPLDMNQLKHKSITFSWEFMFTRPLFQTNDMSSQGRILGQTAQLVDSGAVKTTLGTSLGPMTPQTLAHGHRLLETGHSTGKITLTVL